MGKKMGKRELRDLKVLQALSGEEKPWQVGMTIEPDLLKRWRMEDLREQGYELPKEEEYRGDLSLGRGEREIEIWTDLKAVEALEASRVNRIPAEYAGGNDEEGEEMANSERKKEEKAKAEFKFANTEKLNGKLFETCVSIKQVKSKSTGRWLTIITLGDKQDKVFMVTGRQDGGGTTLSTSCVEYMKTEDKVKQVAERI